MGFMGFIGCMGSMGLMGCTESIGCTDSTDPLASTPRLLSPEDITSESGGTWSDPSDAGGETEPDEEAGDTVF
jgi:hypothetical protein